MEQLPKGSCTLGVSRVDVLTGGYSFLWNLRLGSLTRSTWISLWLMLERRTTGSGKRGFRWEDEGGEFHIIHVIEMLCFHVAGP